MLVTPNFDELSGSLEPGTYNARIIAGEVTESKAGNPMIKWTMEVFGHKDPKMNGLTIFDRTMTTGKGAFRLQDLYRAAMKEELKGPFDTDMLLGKEIKITLVQGTQQDGTPSRYPEVKTVTGI